MGDTILVDANSIGHAAFQAKVLKAGDQETQAVYGAVKGARALRVRYPHAKLIYLWDGLSWRKSVCDEYKANRQDSPEKVAERERYKAQTPLIKKAFRLLGLAQMSATNLEADDLAAILVPRLVAKGDFVRLVTGDRDWLQLVGPKCVWEDHRDETRKVSHSGFEAKTGYRTTQQFVESKALTGDISDNLCGVGKIGEKGAAELLEIWGSVSWFLADPERRASYIAKRPDAKKLPKAFEEFAAMKDRQEIFFRNMRLMDLRGELPSPQNLKLVKGDVMPDHFKLLCYELGFASITRTEAFDNWIEPFEIGKN